jgi:mannose-6-phosphate isomerase
MEPVIFDPILKRIRWGGRKLGTVLGKQIGPASDYAESWEIADHSAGESRVLHGEFDGLTLRELISRCGSEIFGSEPVPQQFPLLIKFLDANDWLSLQVHPDDAQAREFDASESGKTEAWVIVSAEANSEICVGLREGVTRADLTEALRNGTVETCLHRYSVRNGDCILVPAGTVHAIGPGILLAEVQQQSNLTFRLFDWGRLGADGNPRPIHIQESLDCTNFGRGPVDPVATTTVTGAEHTVEDLVRCDYFSLRRHVSGEPFAINTCNRFRILMLLDGTVTIASQQSVQSHHKGTTILLPASCSSVQVVPQTAAVVLEVSGAVDSV